MMLISFIAIVAVFSFYILSALFGRQYRVVLENGVDDDLRLRKQEILAGLNDLEYDFQMKKMKEQDYRQEKEKLLAEGVQIMQKMDAGIQAPKPKIKNPNYKRKIEKAHAAHV